MEAIIKSLKKSPIDELESFIRAAVGEIERKKAKLDNKQVVLDWVEKNKASLRMITRTFLSGEDKWYTGVLLVCMPRGITSVSSSVRNFEDDANDLDIEVYEDPVGELEKLLYWEMASKLKSIRRSDEKAKLLSSTDVMVYNADKK